MQSEIEALLPKPKRKATDTAAAEDEDEDDEDEDDDAVEELPGQTILARVVKKTSEKSIKNELKVMVTAAKDVLKKVEDEIFKIHPDPHIICDFGPLKRLSSSEIQFYEAHKSAKLILRNLREKIDAAGPFKLYPDDLFSDEQKAGMLLF